MSAIAAAATFRRTSMAIRLAATTQQRRLLYSSNAIRVAKKVANQTMPPEAPAEDVGQTAMDHFVNMFDRGSNVGVEVITKDGFVLSNNVQINKSLVLLNGSAFLWQPTAFQSDMSLDAFEIFKLASPKPELVMFGTGKTFSPLPSTIREYFFKLGIQVDQMDTKRAAATYNVLAEEGRRVAAVLLPTNTTTTPSH